MRAESVGCCLNEARRGMLIDIEIGIGIGIGLGIE